MGKRTFVTGGARSGKSAYALGLAASIEGRRAFIATMRPFDEECKARIAAHVKERGPSWTTFEEPAEISDLIRRISGEHDVIVLDCLTLWLTNLMLEEKDVAAHTGNLLDAIKHCPDSVTLIIVTNEVGLGIVPENALARSFRDHAGALNRQVAAICDEAWLVVSGIPVNLKGGAK